MSREGQAKNPITRKEATKICRRFIDDKLPAEGWYQKIEPEIKAIMLYGSVAKGLNKADSDIDLLIIVPLETEQKHTEGEYVYKFEGQEINIVLRSIEKLRAIDFVTDDFQREIFRGCELIFERDSEVRELIERPVS